MLITSAWLPWYAEDGAAHPATFVIDGATGTVALLFLALVVMPSLLAGVWWRALKRWAEPTSGSWWWFMPVGYAVLFMGLAFSRALFGVSGSGEPAIGFAVGIYVALAGVVAATGGVLLRILRPTPIPVFNSAWLRWPFVGVSVAVQALLAFALIIVLFWAVPSSLSSPPNDCTPPRCNIAEPISS